jgi:hypothetical protein
LGTDVRSNDVKRRQEKYAGRSEQQLVDRHHPQEAERRARADDRAEHTAGRDRTEEPLALRDGERLPCEHPELGDEQRPEERAPGVQTEHHRRRERQPVEHERAVGRDQQREDQGVASAEAGDEGGVPPDQHHRERREQRVDQRQATRRDLLEKQRVTSGLEDRVGADQPKEHGRASDHQSALTRTNVQEFGEESSHGFGDYTERSIGAQQRRLRWASPGG